eukprot:552740-Prorocentrum_minimum.AAC.1
MGGVDAPSSGAEVSFVQAVGRVGTRRCWKQRIKCFALMQGSLGCNLTFRELPLAYALLLFTFDFGLR